MFFRKFLSTAVHHPYPGHHVNAHPLSLSKADAKLLLYNIQTKHSRTLFSSFFGTFPQEADSQTDYGLRKEVANRQEECRYTLFCYTRAYKEKKRKELPHLQQVRKHLGNMGITVADQGNRNATSATTTNSQTWQENTGVADHLQQEKNEGQPLTGPLQMWQKVYQCPTNQAIGLVATRLLSLPRQDY